MVTKEIIETTDRFAYSIDGLPSSSWRFAQLKMTWESQTSTRDIDVTQRILVDEAEHDGSLNLLRLSFAQALTENRTAINNNTWAIVSLLWDSPSVGALDVTWKCVEVGCDACESGEYHDETIYPQLYIERSSVERFRMEISKAL